MQHQQKHRLELFYDSMEVLYLRRIYYLLIFIAVCSAACVGMFIALLAGGLQTTTIMARMDSGMAKMTKATDALAQLGTTLPQNQAELTTKQILSIIANTNGVLASVDKDAVAHVSAIMKSVNKETVDDLVAKTTETIGLAQQLLRSVDPAKVDAVLDTAKNVNIDTINNLMKRALGIHKAQVNIDF